MSWPWGRQGAKPIEPRQVAVSIGAMELETAKEILAEVFGARPGEVEEMINSRLEERSWDEVNKVNNICQEKREEKLWPATFSVGE
jgi:hypothetical protein